MKPVEIVATTEVLVSCDGGGDPGHPVVFLNLSPAGCLQCPYCSRSFVNAGAAVPDAGEHGYSSVVTPSARGPGAAENDEASPPVQSPGAS